MNMTGRATQNYYENHDNREDDLFAKLAKVGGWKTGAKAKDSAEEQNLFEVELLDRRIGDIRLRNCRWADLSWEQCQLSAYLRRVYFHTCRIFSHMSTYLRRRIFYVFLYTSSTLSAITHYEIRTRYVRDASGTGKDAGRWNYEDDFGRKRQGPVRVRRRRFEGTRLARDVRVRRQRFEGTRLAPACPSPTSAFRGHTLGA